MSEPQVAATASAPRREAPRALAAGITHRTSSYNIDPLRMCLKPDFNTRFDMGDLEGLADQIETELARDPESGGLLYPLKVRRIPPTDPRAKNFDFEVEHGNRRTLAIQDILVKKRGLKFPHGVRADIIYKGQDELTSLVHLFVTNSGKALNPLEEAATFKRILAPTTGFTVKQLAKAIGKTVTHINETLALIVADPSVQEALKKKEITATNAKAIAKVEPAAQKELVETAKAAKGGGATAKQARAKLHTKLREKDVAKAVESGKKLKMRSLSNAQLSSLGAEVAVLLYKKAKDANCQFIAGDVQPLLDKVMKDEKMAMAFTLGAFQALKVAGGVTFDLDI